MIGQLGRHGWASRMTWLPTILSGKRPASRENYVLRTGRQWQHPPRSSSYEVWHQPGRRQPAPRVPGRGIRREAGEVPLGRQVWLPLPLDGGGLPEQRLSRHPAAGPGGGRGAGPGTGLRGPAAPVPSGGGGGAAFHPGRNLRRASGAGPGPGLAGLPVRGVRHPQVGTPLPVSARCWR